MQALITRIKNMAPFEHNTSTGPELYQCQSSPPVPWDRWEIEKELQISLPSDIEELWNLSSSLELFKPVEDGLIRLQVFGPHQVIDSMKNLPAYRHAELRTGDLVLGRFLGEDDLLIVRCDAAADDFGIVIEADTLDGRAEWLIAARRLSEFLQMYLDSDGDWFWLTSDTPRLGG